MRLSNRQKAMLHWVPAALGIGEADRLTLQRNVGGFESAADPRATRSGFIALMAHYESCFRGRRIRGFTAGYWADEDAKAKGSPPRSMAAGSPPTDALVFACRRQAQALGWDEAKLDAFLAGKHMSSGNCRSVATAPAYWLGRLLNALKAMAQRQGEKSCQTPSPNR